MLARLEAAPVGSDKGIAGRERGWGCVLHFPSLWLLVLVVALPSTSSALLGGPQLSQDSLFLLLGPLDLGRVPSPLLLAPRVCQHSLGVGARVKTYAHLLLVMTFALCSWRRGMRECGVLRERCVVVTLEQGWECGGGQRQEGGGGHPYVS